jgi:uncharacterized protein YdhG (YjbR/CyaY superfamily)
MSEAEKKRARRSGAKDESFTDAEKAAMKERARELKAETRASKGKAQGESDLLAKIAEMPEPDRSMATRIHEIVRTNAPELSPKTWYGMPAYARDGKVVCFFQSSHKFESRYSTLGFNDAAKLDDGEMWPASFAVVALTPDVEARIAALVRKAVGTG